MIVLEGILNSAIVLLAILVHLNIIGDDIVLASRCLHSFIFVNILVRSIVHICTIVDVVNV